MAAQNADYPLADRLMDSNKVSRQTYLIFSLAEQYLKNAEFQLGRYHAAVAERKMVMNIMTVLSDKFKKLRTELKDRSIAVSDNQIENASNITRMRKFKQNESDRLMREHRDKMRIQFLEAHLYFVVVQDVQKLLIGICTLEKEDSELQELKKELISSQAFSGARNLLEHIDRDITKGDISDLGNITGDREEIFTYQHKVKDGKGEVGSAKAYLNETELIAIKQLVQRAFEILNKRPPESGEAADLERLKDNRGVKSNIVQGNIM